MQVMQALPQDVATLACVPLSFSGAFEHPLNSKTKPHSSRHLSRWKFSVADASLSVQKDLLNEDKLKQRIPLITFWRLRMPPAISWAENHCPSYGFGDRL
ncbi:hypothetical protein MKY34_07670 [Sporosarcina sp. FSL K6-1522]|uniref:hypothetical protein n=1 Tax=Sporosarcina sp. FSL K6-1522 TaxID=2921554 RepID=UPI003159E586